MNITNVIAIGNILCYEVYHHFKQINYYIQYEIISYECFKRISIWKSIFRLEKQKKIKSLKIPSKAEYLNIKF